MPVIKLQRAHVVYNDIPAVWIRMLDKASVYLVSSMVTVSQRRYVGYDAPRHLAATHIACNSSSVISSF